MQARCLQLVMTTVLALACAAQEAPPAPRPYTFRSDVELVLLDAVVRDRNNAILGNLTKDDFRLFDDGKEQPLRYVSKDELPIALALILDRSGSMMVKIRELRRSAAKILAQLKPEDEVALFAFSHDVERLVGLTTDRERVAEVLDQIHAGGSTNILDALYEASRHLKEAAPDKRRVVIIISDNLATVRGQRSQAEVIDTAFEFETSVYGLHVLTLAPFTTGGLLVRMFVPVSVKKIVEATGGEMVDARKFGSLSASLAEMIGSLRTRYTLGFKPPGAPDDRTRRIKLQLADRFGRPGRDYYLVYRRGYRRISESRTAAR